MRPSEIRSTHKILLLTVVPISVAGVILSKAPAFGQSEGPRSRAEVGRMLDPLIELQASGVANHFNLRAVSAPVSLVLDEVARNAGIAVTYEGPPPTDPVTVTLINRSGTEIVLNVLEGIPYNYAARWDQRVARVDMLVVSARAPIAAKTGAQVYSLALPIEPADLAVQAELKTITEAENATLADATLSTSDPPDKIKEVPAPGGLLHHTAPPRR